MNTANVAADLTNAINTAVGNGDLTQPLDTVKLVNSLVPLVQAAETEAVQHARDVARANLIVAGIGRNVPAPSN